MKHRLMNGLERTPQGFASSSGQALVETALIVPFLLMLALNTINFAYFFVVAINLAAAPRSGTLYSTLGFADSQFTLRCLPPARLPGARRPHLLP